MPDWETRRRLQHQFAAASQTAARDRYDFDQVHRLLTDCVVAEPAQVPYVAALLENLRRKYRDNQKGRTFAWLFSAAEFHKAANAQDWSHVLQHGPAALLSNPWSAQTLRPLASACAALGHREAELCYLEFGLLANALDREYQRHAAQSLQQQGAFEAAADCWRRVLSLAPQDVEAAQFLQLLIGEPLRYAAPIASAPSSPETSPNLESVLRDVDHYLQVADDVAAERRLAEFRSVGSNSLPWQERWEDLELLRSRKKLAVAERLAAASPSPETQALVTRFRRELNQSEVDVFNVRAERYPTDVAWKFQLAVRLKRAGSYAEAVKIFVPVTADPKYQAVAWLELGECQQMMRRFDRAIEAYRASLIAPETPEFPVRSDVLYRAAVLAEGLNDLASARPWFEELVQRAPNYKDAAVRLDKIRKISDK